MSDYTQNTTFATKDALLTGNPEKIILGADFDGEFSEIATASASKEDSANKGQASGYCGLSSSSLVEVAFLPVATTSAIGCLELATQAEAEALSSDAKYITPHTLNDVLADNGSMLQDIQALADPGADRVLGWDDSAGAAIAFAVTEGVQQLLTNVKLDYSGLGAATIVGTDTVSFFDATDSVHKKCTMTAFEAALTVENLINGVDMSGVTITAGEGLAYSVGGTDLTSDATLDLDVTNLTALAGTLVAAADEFLVWDAGASEHKKIVYKSMGIPIITKTSDATLTDDEMNSYILGSHASVAISLTLNTGVGEKGNVIIIEQGLAAQVDVDGTSTVNAAIGLKTRATNSVITLTCTATDVWTMSGDAAA